MSVVSTSDTVPLNKVRLAIVGTMCSGKTFAIDRLIERLCDLQLDISCQRISLRTVLQNEFGHDGILTHETAHILRRNHVIHKLCEQIIEERDVVIVEDVRYNEEIEYLKERGFKIALIETPWHIRLERLQKNYKNPVELIGKIQWISHNSELDMGRLDGFDYVAESVLVNKFVEKIINSI